jgi:hypothetical protein
MLVSKHCILFAEHLNMFVGLYNVVLWIGKRKDGGMHKVTIELFACLVYFQHRTEIPSVTYDENTLRGSLRHHLISMKVEISVIG